MFLFSWKKIYKISSGDVGATYLILRMLVNEQIPKNKYDPIYKFYDKDYSGQSFLVKAKELFDNSHRYSKKEVVEYVALASFRPYSDYLMNGTKTLPVINSPLPLNKLKQNRLLRIENDIIHFMYEEANT